MTREDKYLLGCLFAIHQIQEKGSTMIQVNGETILWKEICEWIEKQYGIEKEKTQ